MHIYLFMFQVNVSLPLSIYIMLDIEPLLYFPLINTNSLFQFMLNMKYERLLSRMRFYEINLCILAS